MDDDDERWPVMYSVLRQVVEQKCANEPEIGLSAFGIISQPDLRRRMYSSPALGHPAVE